METSKLKFMKTTSNEAALPPASSSASSRGRRTFRGCPWLDRETDTDKYGIQVKLTGFEVRWLHCCEGNKPMIYDTAEERDAKMKELRHEEKSRQNAPAAALATLDPALPKDVMAG